MARHYAYTLVRRDIHTFGLHGFSVRAHAVVACGKATAAVYIAGISIDGDTSCCVLPQRNCLVARLPTRWRRSIRADWVGLPAQTPGAPDRLVMTALHEYLGREHTLQPASPALRALPDAEPWEPFWPVDLAAARTVWTPGDPSRPKPDDNLVHVQHSAYHLFRAVGLARWQRPVDGMRLITVCLAPASKPFTVALPLFADQWPALPGPYLQKANEHGGFKAGDVEALLLQGLRHTRPMGPMGVAVLARSFPAGTTEYEMAQAAYEALVTLDGGNGGSAPPLLRSC